MAPGRHMMPTGIHEGAQLHFPGFHLSLLSHRSLDFRHVLSVSDSSTVSQISIWAMG
jgi:hypothetical protein